jgi:hypothetical protein
MRFKRDFIHVQKDKSERKSKYSRMANRLGGPGSKTNKYRDQYGDEAIRKAAESAAIEKAKLEARILLAAIEKAEMEAAAAAETAAREAEILAEKLAREAEIAAETAAREAEIAAETAAREAEIAAETAARLVAEADAQTARDALAAETVSKATLSQNERDQLYSVSGGLDERIADLEWNENIKIGESALDVITPRGAGDPSWNDPNYDVNNDTYLYTDNIVLGTQSLRSHTTPIFTVAIGAYSQENSIYDAAHDGPDPVNSPYNLGNRSVSVGAMTLQNGTTQSRNTAVGYSGLSNITTGYDNVGIGSYALRMTTVAAKSVAVGSYANAYNTTGWGNVAVGYSSLLNCTNSGNVSVGYKAGQNVVNAWYNTLMGQSVAQTLTTGTNNILIGNSAEPSSAGIHNEITLGNNGISNIRCNVQSISALSDSRDKAEITDIPEDAGLQFIDKLRPVTFYWDRREWYSDNTSDGSKMNKVHSTETPNSGQRMGFIAQEVLDVVNDYKYIKESGMVSESNPEKLEFALGSLVTPLVKAVQQLSEQNKELLDRITILEQK